MTKPKGVLVLLILITFGFSGGILYWAGTHSIRTHDLRFSPSSPLNWTQIDTRFALHGRLYFPLGYDATSQYPTVILFHGLGGQLEHNHVLAQQLATRGILTLSVSFRGHGESGGTFPFENSSLYNATFGDALGAYRYLTTRSDVDLTRIGGMGQSLGGGAALFLGIVS